ncbi:MAG: 16S rRNA (adenine(1518)-N(6)/adenine(1519)-N(6))-dimethyltransferase RsmA [Anaerolineaceae bacterium]|jgi:16S rRNA (adenine1518-N6/adenine1519-N6)-dimethyltransferase|nr:16S rRNA (adenine(1518)-N(6)/adenine(1519)-N(6))-dimethyltransferase RsmA [Anaerolineaceae bacterium]
MDPALIPTPLNVRNLLREHGLIPKKSLGQNFLVENGALEKVVNAAEIEPVDVVLEIGAGLGSLTRFLSVTARKVVAVELDSHLLPILETVLGSRGNVELVYGDILKLDPARLISVDQYLVVANIPYYITSAIFRHLLAAKRKPRRIVMTIQREVAQRICAEPGDMSLLALSVQVFGTAKIVAKISAGSFYPAPKVDSAVIRVDLYPEPLVEAAMLDRFFQLTRAGFGQKRKMLRKSLAAGLSLPVPVVEDMLLQNEIDPTRRAETLSLDEWGKLTEYYDELIARSS